MKTYFDHEKLDVYQEAIAFCGWVGELLSQISAKAAAKDQLYRASTSLPLNIAEGNGTVSNVDCVPISGNRSRFSTGVCRMPRCACGAKTYYW